MKPQQLVSLALRVLSAWSSGQRPDPGDLEVLRRHAPPDCATDLEFDELACYVIKYETDRVLAGSRRSRKGIKRDAPAPKMKIA